MGRDMIEAICPWQRLGCLSHSQTLSRAEMMGMGTRPLANGTAIEQITNRNKAPHPSHAEWEMVGGRQGHGEQNLIRHNLAAPPIIASS
jgi:hypothetical protein